MSDFAKGVDEKSLGHVSGIFVPQAGSAAAPPIYQLRTPTNFFPDTGANDRYYFGSGMPRSTGSISSVIDIIMWNGCPLPAGITITEIGVRTAVAANPGDLFRCALYEPISPTLQFPGDLAAQTGDIDINGVAGVHFVVLPTAFVVPVAGLYWFATWSSLTITVTSDSGSTTPSFLGSAPNAGAAAWRHLRQTLTFVGNVFPATYVFDPTDLHANTPPNAIWRFEQTP
jgi:hypothetical protein